MKISLSDADTQLLLQALVALKIVPQKILTKEQKIRTLKDINNNHEPYIRLARSGGTINYAFGKASPIGATTLPAGLWIEQDRFVIRRLRLPSQAEIGAEDFDDFSGLLYPKNRSVSWDQKTVSLKTVRVAALPTSEELKQRFQVSYLRSKRRETKNAITTPADLAANQIKDFYSRFR